MATGKKTTKRAKPKAETSTETTITIRVSESTAERLRDASYALKKRRRRGEDVAAATQAEIAESALNAWLSANGF